MKQLTKKQAIEFYESKIWEDWTDEEIVRLQLFQEILCVDYVRYHKAISNVFGRLVLSHELDSFNLNNLREEYLDTKSKPLIQEIIDLIPEEKRIIIKS